MASGLVSLVGAGPGDVELLTLKGKRVLEQADAVFYDELANPALLDFAPAAAERLYVGKRAHYHAMAQDEIAAWMIERARRGWRVVRLKGGDPFVFGRGGEEAQALAAAGVAWEVVPGISAGIGVPTAAGIPLTHRGLASSVRFVTGHSAFQSAGDFAPAAREETLVVFMGLERLEAIAAELLARGWRPDTPAALIENGTLPQQRIVNADLAALPVAARGAGVRPPALLIVGDVVGAAAHLRAPAAAAPAAEPQPAIILLAHGSPLPGWQLEAERLARDLAAPGQFTCAAYLPPVRPGLAEAVAQAARTGARNIAVVPYFLAAGLHVTRDLPLMIEAERRRFPQLRIETSACLEGHPALRTAVLARAGEALARLRQRASTHAPAAASAIDERR